MNNVDNSKIERHLGKTSEYKSIYDNSLLVSEPRQSNRNHLNINESNLPFIGHDIWNGYEVSFLLNHGLPVSAIAKVTYSANSKYIVESKSIKLYMNSFNMEAYQGNIISVLQQLEAVMENDLSKLLETEVRVCVRLTKAIDDAMFYPSLFPTSLYPTLENNIDVTAIKVRGYKEDPSILSWTEGDSNEVQRFHSALLKSNCRVTSQPDWGDVYIHYKGPYQLNQTSLLQYIVSFRDECHFHEEICETIYKRLYDLTKPEELMVSCLYVRRGGIDINPIRANSQELLKQNGAMWDKWKYFTKTVRQ